MRHTASSASTSPEPWLGRAAVSLSLCLVGGVTLVGLPGCTLLTAPTKVVDAVVPRGSSKQPDPVDLQVQVQRFADDYAAQTATAVDEYVHRVGTEEARVQGLQWKLAEASAAIGFASGPQPKANLLDLVALSVLNRITVEEGVLHSTNREALRPWLETSRSLETNAWVFASHFLTPAQISELRDAITDFQNRNPGVRGIFAARPQEFASMVKTTRQPDADGNSVFSLVGLDPTAGLDPAVHEITLTRLFAERAMFTLQRMPTLLRWQTELLSHHLVDQPGVRAVLTNAAHLTESVDRISRAADTASQTAAQLPDRISAERKAILAALDQQEGKLRELVGEVDRSLVAADRMSGSLTVTITNFDALMKRFGVGEPSTNAPASSNSPPFNILDYAQTATQIGTMARDLNTLVTSVNQSVPRLERLSQQAGADAQRVVDRSFRLGLVLIGLLLGGGVAAGLLYRFLANRMAAPRREASSFPAAKE
jgi:hypothetical protein